MNNNKDKLITYVFTLIFLAIFLFQYLFINNEDEILVSALSVFLLVIYLYSCVNIFKKYGYLAIQSMLLITFGVFNLSRIFFTLFGYGTPFYKINSLIKYDLPINVQITTLQIMILFLIIYQHFVLIHCKEEFKLNVSTDIELVKIGKVIMLIILPFVCYRFINEAILIKQQGYVTLYIGGLRVDNYNIIIRMSVFLFSIGYYSLISGLPEQKVFRKYSMLYFLVMLIDTLKGSRGQMICFIIFYLWFNRYVYGKKIKLKFIALLSILVIVASQVIAIKRVNSTFVNTSLVNMIADFLYLQGQSLIVPALYINYKSNLSYNLYPYILDPIIYIYNCIVHPYIMTIGQSVDMINIRFDLGHHLTFFLNKNYYLNGKSIGDNFLAELYEFGLIGIGIGAFLVTKIIQIVNKYMCSKRIFLFFSFEIVMYIIYMPRTTFFYNTYELARLLSGYGLVCLIKAVLNKGVAKNICESNQ